MLDLANPRESVHRGEITDLRWIEPQEPFRWPKPEELWSLWDMITLKLRDLIEAASRVAQMQQMFFVLEDTGLPKAGALNATSLGGVLGSAEHLLAFSREADLDATEASAERLVSFIQEMREEHLRTRQMPNSDEHSRHLQDLVSNAHQSLKDQLKKRFVLMLTRTEAELYQSERPLFGEEVFDKFNDAVRDIEEAGKCLALGRNTATVFHLMLVMERALRVLAQKIGISVLDKNGQFERWGVIVSNVKAKIPSLPPDQQSPWTEAHNLLWGVGKAWRNETMHPADAYTDGEASRIFDAVKGFMGRLVALV